MALRGKVSWSAKARFTYALPTLAFTVSEYHSIVRRSPSRRSAVALKPNSSHARVVSRHRRGWPLGFVESHTSWPWKPVCSAPSRSRSRAGRIRRESAEDLFEELADRMANEDVALLDAGCRGRRDAEAHVAEIAHLATAFARQADDDHLLLARGLDRLQDVGAVAARRDGEEDVAFPAVGAHFAREDQVVAIVVGDRRE